MLKVVDTLDLRMSRSSDALEAVVMCMCPINPSRKGCVCVLLCMLTRTRCSQEWVACCDKLFVGISMYFSDPGLPIIFRCDSACLQARTRLAEHPQNSNTRYVGFDSIVLRSHVQLCMHTVPSGKMKIKTSNSSSS